MKFKFLKLFIQGVLILELCGFSKVALAQAVQSRNAESSQAASVGAQSARVAEAPPAVEISARSIGPQDLRQFASDLGFTKRQNRMDEAIQKLEKVFPEGIKSEWDAILRGRIQDAAKDPTPVFINFRAARIILQQGSRAMVIQFSGWPQDPMIRFNQTPVALSEVLHLPLLLNLLEAEAKTASVYPALPSFVQMFFESAEAQSQNRNTSNTDIFLILIGLMAGAFVLWPYLSGSSSSSRTTTNRASPARFEPKPPRPNTAAVEAGVRAATHNSQNSCRAFPAPSTRADLCDVGRVMIDYELSYSQTRALFCSGARRGATADALTEEAHQRHRGSFESNMRRQQQNRAYQTRARANLRRCMDIVRQRQEQGCNPLQPVQGILARQPTGSFALRRCHESSSQGRAFQEQEFAGAYRTMVGQAGFVDPCAIVIGDSCGTAAVGGGSSGLPASGTR